MSDARRDVLDALSDLGELLARPSALGAMRDGRARLQRRVESLEQRALSVEKTLVVLLVGGTGVGKSTFLNALAKEDVASVSNARRAHTSRLNLYHHEEVPVEALTDGMDDAFEQHTHRAHALRDKVVIDAPDVDSIALEHRELVQRFLPRVDVVLYLTSWQKYKNRDVCEFVAGLRGNHFFLFALNQLDVVRESERDLVAGDFGALLEGFGFERPRVLGISAKGALEPEGDGLGFERLEGILRDRIRGEEIRRIKESGLLSRLRSLLREVAAGLRAEDRGGLASLETDLRAAARSLRAHREELSRELVHEVERVVETSRARFEQRYHHLRDRDASGPYGLFLRLTARLFPERGGPATGAAARPQALRVQAALARAAERARATLRPLAIDDDEIGTARADDLAERLLDVVRRATSEAWIGGMPAPRSPIAVNAAPTGALLFALGLYFYLAIADEAPGVVYLVASLLLFAFVCLAQYEVLRAADRRAFRQASGGKDALDVARIVDDAPLSRALAEHADALDREADLVAGLRSVGERVSDLQATALDLPDELRL